MRKLISIIVLLAICVSANAADVTIKNVPEGSEDHIKAVAVDAIANILYTRDMTVSKETKDKYEADVDAALVANGLPKQYDVER